ncbi:hypothetical protein GCM10010405_54260 [Streptomyces macrosporus]|uniref:Transposase n=1 Tax=Streptomyces macrosporus TaxID=44032 RepID=A0ABP5XSM9_9ACTN
MHLLSDSGFSAASNDAGKTVQVPQTDRLTHRHPRGKQCRRKGNRSTDQGPSEAYERREQFIGHGRRLLARRNHPGHALDNENRA